MNPEYEVVHPFVQGRRISFKFLVPVATILLIGFVTFGAYKELVSEVNASITDYAASLPADERP